mmetsp:Transcript_51533/g.122561  ORF Transcript_51533/g.122561 Transcript_51533/m.122561 type:complete len:216 (+) Transcript_51533:2420-3067(+)
MALASAEVPAMKQVGQLLLLHEAAARLYVAVVVVEKHPLVAAVPTLAWKLPRRRPCKAPGGIGLSGEPLKGTHSRSAFGAPRTRGSLTLGKTGGCSSKTPSSMKSGSSTCMPCMLSQTASRLSERLMFAEVRMSSSYLLMKLEICSRNSACSCISHSCCLFKFMISVPMYPTTSISTTLVVGEPIFQNSSAATILCENSASSTPMRWVHLEVHPN